MSKTTKTVSAPASVETNNDRLPLGKPVVVRIVACQKAQTVSGKTYTKITVLGDNGSLETGEWLSLSDDMPTFGTVTTVVVMYRKYEVKKDGKTIKGGWTTIIGK
jgi:hypothetical protein